MGGRGGAGGGGGKHAPTATAGEIAEIVHAPISDASKRRLLKSYKVPKSKWPAKLR